MGKGQFQLNGNLCVCCVYICIGIYLCAQYMGKGQFESSRKELPVVTCVGMVAGMCACVRLCVGRGVIVWVCGCVYVCVCVSVFVCVFACDV